MNTMRKAHKFAIKWLNKFNDKNKDFTKYFESSMGDECAELGFEMDCGHAFERVYGEAVYNADALNRVIGEITDVQLLGSAIYSRWRYFNHWAYDGQEIKNPENRKWFSIALERLVNITGDGFNLFEGTPRKLRIVSNSICYGPCPKPDDEIEQRLTINEKGGVWFSSYAYGEGYGKYMKIRSDNFRINKIATTEILNKVATYFSKEELGEYMTDCGSWTMELTNTLGETYYYGCSLSSNLQIDGIDLSDFIRDTLDMQTLYVFDGNNKPDVINRIIVDYHCRSISEDNGSVNEVKNRMQQGRDNQEYSEQLRIDRFTETLEIVRNYWSGAKTMRTYEAKTVPMLLDSFDGSELFCSIPERPDDIIEDLEEVVEYKITIEYKKSSKRVITGIFDKYGLPDDYEMFADEVCDYLAPYGLGLALNYTKYGATLRRKSDYIYCSVVFNGYGKSYYYVTDDESIQVGDFVYVPSGKDNHESLVEVVDVEYFSREDVPLALEKVKSILRKNMDE